MPGHPSTPRQNQRQAPSSGSNTPQRELQPFTDFAPSPGGPSSLAEEDDGDENVFRDWSFDEVLEDLNTRFLVNLPEEEMTLVRLYWQAEQAHWFYEDYVRPLNPLLPSLSQRQFTHLIIESSPLYGNLEGGIDYDAVWAEYCAYKKMVPCCGGILINSTGDKCLMVRGWKSNAGWCFPRGKINSNESEMACAIREVEEETGFDMSALVNEDDFVKTQVNTQDITMFIANGIDEATVFETQTRKEIGAIEWVPFADLPTWTNKKGPKRTGGKGQKRFYNVTPFVGPLKKWLQRHGINPNPPRKGGKGAARERERERERDLLPYSLNDSPAQHRQLQPFSFGDEPHQSAHHAPSTAIDHLFAKFVQKDQKADNVAALQSDTARNLDKLFCGLEVSPRSAQQQEHDRQDDMLAQLLGNVGSVSNQPPPPTNAKQSHLLSLLNAPAKPAPAPAPQSSHQNNLLSMLAPAHGSAPLQAQLQSSIDDERAQRHRALLDSTLSGLGPPTPGKGGQGMPSPGQMMSPMQQLPPSQTHGWQYSNQQGSPHAQAQGPPQHISQPPPPNAYYGGQQQPPQSPHHVSQPQQPQQYPGPPPAHQGQLQSPQHQQQPPVNDHQRNLLGALFAAKPGPAQAQIPVQPNSHVPPPNGIPQSQYAPYPPQHQAYPPHQGYANQPPPPHIHDRPPLGLQGLAHQPGQGSMPFHNGAPPPPGGWQLGAGSGPQYGAPAGYGPPPAALQQQYAPPPGVYQQQQQQQQPPPLPQESQISQQSAPPQPPPSVQSPPMHQPVARPPVGGPLLSLAAGH